MSAKPSFWVSDAAAHARSSTPVVPHVLSESAPPSPLGDGGGGALSLTPAPEFSRRKRPMGKPAGKPVGLLFPQPMTPPPSPMASPMASPVASPSSATEGSPPPKRNRPERRLFEDDESDDGHIAFPASDYSTHRMERVLNYDVALDARRDSILYVLVDVSSPPRDVVAWCRTPLGFLAHETAGPAAKTAMVAWLCRELKWSEARAKARVFG